MANLFDRFDAPVAGVEPKLKRRIQAELVIFLYKQFLPGLAGEACAIVFLAICFIPVVSASSLLLWLAYCIFISDSYRVTLLICYRKYRSRLPLRTWKQLFILNAMLSGSIWGLATILWISDIGIIYQTFLIIFIVGVSCVANGINSASRMAYTSFFMLANIPIIVWLFLQGGIYIYLGLCGLVYAFISISTCFNTHQLLFESLLLRFKNTSLDEQNMMLGEEVSKKNMDLNQSLALIKSTLESTEDKLIVLNLAGETQFYNAQVLEMLRIPESKIHTLFLDKNIHLILEQLTNPDRFMHTHNLFFLASEEEVHDEIEFINGRIFECYSKPHKLEHKIIGRILGFRDITQRRRLEQQISYQATHDSLTHLANRSLLYDRLEHSINFSNRYHTKLVIMIIDIDHFKEVNDSLGHYRGDKLIECIGTRLSQSIRKSDTAARLAGDEFVLLFNSDFEQDVIHFCNKILQLIAKPILLDDEEEVTVTACIGVSIYPDNGHDTSTLLKCADLALFMAKRTGLGQFQLYNDELSQGLKRHQDIQAQLITALNHDEFTLVYQPVINIQTNEFASVEALIRWNNPLLGAVSPSEFIPIAEESNLIILLTEWVINRACDQNKEWAQQGVGCIKIAVNISSIHLKRGHLVNTIDEALKRTEMDPSYLQIELIETSLMDASKKILSNLNKLGEKGIEIAIDDFGTGYSSFRYLKEFPASKLKIDRSFVKEGTLNSSSRSIINAIVTMGHELNLSVLAEGVETEEELQVIKNSGCDEVQGFIFSQPLPPDELVRFIKKWRKNSEKS